MTIVQEKIKALDNDSLLEIYGYLELTLYDPECNYYIDTTCITLGDLCKLILEEISIRNLTDETDKVYERLYKGNKFLYFAQTPIQIGKFHK